jgi:hypothetical protein
MKKFLFNFLVFSLVGIVFLRPQIFKNHIKIKANEVIYFHGFPITSMVKVIPSAELKYYEVALSSNSPSTPLIDTPSSF